MEEFEGIESRIESSLWWCEIKAECVWSVLLGQLKYIINKLLNLQVLMREIDWLLPYWGKIATKTMQVPTQIEKPKGNIIYPLALQHVDLYWNNP